MWQPEINPMRPQSFDGRLSFGDQLLLAVAALMLIMTTGAQACPICFSGLVLTTGQQLDAADRAVLAAPAPDGGQFRIVDVVKGKGDIGEIIAEPVSKLDAAATASGKPLLLLRNELAQLWTSMGPIRPEYAGWLRQLAAGGSVGKASAKQLGREVC